MLNLGAWVVVILTAAMVMAAILWVDKKLDGMKHDVERLTGLIIDDVLDAVDDLVFPLSERDREIIHERLGEDL